MLSSLVHASRANAKQRLEPTKAEKAGKLSVSTRTSKNTLDSKKIAMKPPKAKQGNRPIAPIPSLPDELMAVTHEAINLARAEHLPERARHSAYGLIIQTALKLFAEQSIDRVSIQDIATSAGVSKANVFHHFDNKDSLMRSIVQWLSRPHAEFAESLHDLPYTSAEKIRALIRYEFLLITENPTLMQFMVQLWSRPPQSESDDDRVCPKTIFQRNINAVMALFHQGQTRGEFRQDFPPYLPTMVLGGMKHLIARNQHWRQLMNQEPPTPPAAKSRAKKSTLQPTHPCLIGHGMNSEVFINDFSMFILSAMRPI